MPSSLSSRTIGHLLLILLLGALAYANSFTAPFIFDDLTSIVRNPVVQDLANFGPGGSGYESMPRRWVGFLSFALNHHFGGLEVGGYHLVNLIIHLGNALLLYALVLLTFRTPQLAGGRLGDQAANIALLAALLFVAHPVQTGAVTYIVQRLSSLATLFYLAALVLYLMARLAGEKRRAAAPGPGIKPNWRQLRPEIIPLTWAMLAAILAMQTKEIAFTLPLAVALYEWSFFRDAWRRRWPYLLPLLVTLPVIPLMVLNSLSGEDSLEPGGVDEQLRVDSDISRFHYLITQFRVMVTYLRLLVLPVKQNLDYDYPIYTSILHPQVLGSLLLLGLLAALGVYLHRRSAATDPDFRLISFGIFWFFLTLTVESTLIPIRDLIFEHRLYLPSLGVAMAVAAAVGWSAVKTATLFSGRLPLLVAALVVVSLAGATWQRNQVWGSSVKIWEDTARKSPNKVRSWYNLGTHLDEAGRPEEAIRVLTRAVYLDPQHADAWHNLGRAHLNTGASQQAIPFLRNAVQLNPTLDNAVVNLAVALIRAEQPAEAVLIFEGNMQRLAGWPEVHLNLAIAYALTGDLDAARRELVILEGLAPHLAAPLRAGIEQAASEPTPLP